MDAHPTPFPAKFQPVKSKYNWKITDPASKTNAKDPPTQRQQRSFGTTRNPNLPTKSAIEKPITKPSSGVPKKQPKSTQPTKISTDLAPIPVTEPTEKSPDINKAKPKKKSVSFQENVGENVGKNSSERKIAEPKTPVRSPSLAKTGGFGTPYLSAERCSNCRFDRLETSSYWLCQIKLAESVGKHFVSAAFFQLAFESNAEPIRNLRVELKRYLARHAYLSAETKWIDTSRIYGLLKDDEINATEVDSGSGKATGTTGKIHDQEEPKEEAIEEPQAKGIPSVRK